MLLQLAMKILAFVSAAVAVERAAVRSLAVDLVLLFDRKAVTWRFAAGFAKFVVAASVETVVD